MLKTLAEINAQVVMIKRLLEKMHDPKLEMLGLALAVLQEELIEMDLYGTFTPNP